MPPIPQSFYSLFGGGPTQFRAAVYQTLTERFEEFQDFYFAGGHLSLIAFADTVDDSTVDFVDQPDFIKFLGKQDATRTASISAITVGDPDVRRFWQEAANQTGGVVTSSATPSVNLERVVNASLGLTKTFVLQEVPAVAPRSLVITYRGNQQRLVLGEDYSFDFPRNAIELNGPAPFTGSRITVKYQRRVEGEIGAPPPPATDDGGGDDGGGDSE
ncbi:MAG: hypothetical protein AAGA48_19320 [Myxococcota bacterium]